MEDPTWFWGGIEQWKPPQRHLSAKRWVTIHKNIIRDSSGTINVGVDLLGGNSFSPHGRQPIGESSESIRRGRKGEQILIRLRNQNFLLIRFVPREKLRLCGEQSRLIKPPASRPKLYYKQYEQKYWKWNVTADDS